MDTEPCLDVDIQSDSCDTDESGEVRRARQERKPAKTKRKNEKKPLKSLSNFTMLVGKNLIFFAVG